MKTLCSLLLLLCLTAFPAVAAGADAFKALNDALQRGLLAEEAQRDLPAAAAAYAEAVRAGVELRAPLATALFRLAETQRRLGRTNEALVHYRRLLREFPDQTNLTSLALRFLPATVPTPSASPRSEQERLLLEEIKLAEMQEADVRKRMEAGRAGQDEVFKAQRDLLALKRQLAALPRLLDVAVTPASTGTDSGSTNPPVNPYAEVDKLAAELAALDQLSDVEEKARILMTRHSPLGRLEAALSDMDSFHRPPLTSEMKARNDLLQANLEAQVKSAIDSLKERLRFAQLEADNLQKRQAARTGLGKVVLYGEGGLSGTFPIPVGEKLMLSDVILRAGGGNGSAVANLKKVRLHRQTPDGKGEVTAIDVEQILKKGDRTKDVELQEGDRIEVPARSIVF